MVQVAWRGYPAICAYLGAGGLEAAEADVDHLAGPFCSLVPVRALAVIMWCVVPIVWVCL